MWTSYVMEVSWAEMSRAWVDHCCNSFSHTHAHTLPLVLVGERLAVRGYRGCGSVGCVMQCFGCCVFPENPQGLELNYFSGLKKRSTLPKHSHIHTAALCFIVLAMGCFYDNKTCLSSVCMSHTISVTGYKWQNINMKMEGFIIHSTLPPIA